MKDKKILPYAGIPVIAALYIALKLGTVDTVTIIRAVMLISFLYIAAYLDIKTRKIPNKLVIAMLLAWLIFTSVYVIVNMEAAIPFLIQSLIGGFAASLFFGFMYVVSRKGIGGGDVKLMAVTGLFLTLAKLMPMLFISSVLAALVSAGLLVTKRATMKTTIPLVPFLYIGTLITIFV